MENQIEFQTSIDDLRNATLADKIQLLQLIERMYGKERTEPAWFNLGLPDIAAITAYPDIIRDGAKCLAHILDTVVDTTNGRTARKIIHDILLGKSEDELRDNDALEFYGLRVQQEAGSMISSLLVSTSPQICFSIFKNTLWQKGKHTEALSSLSGAKVLNKQHTFAGRASTVISIPVEHLK